MFLTVSRGSYSHIVRYSRPTAEHPPPSLWLCSYELRSRGWRLAGATPLSSMCSSECFRLIAESNNAAKSKSWETEEGKQGCLLFMGLIRFLARTTCKTKANKKAEGNLYLCLFRLNFYSQEGLTWDLLVCSLKTHARLCKMGPCFAVACEVTKYLAFKSLCVQHMVNTHVVPSTSGCRRRSLPQVSLMIWCKDDGIHSRMNNDWFV